MSWARTPPVARSLRLRLTLCYLGVFVFFCLLVGGFVGYRLRHDLDRADREFLKDELRELAKLVSARGGERGGALDLSSVPWIGHDSKRTVYRVFDPDGRLISEAGGSRKFPTPDGSGGTGDAEKGIVFQTARVGDSRYRHLFATKKAATDAGSAWTVQVGFHQKLVVKRMRNYWRNLFYATALGGILAGLAGWWLAGRNLAPLDEIAETVQGLEARRLGERVPVRGVNDELDRLGTTFNGMLARLEAAFESQKRFLQDASHEFRTPLAALSGNVEVTLHRERSAGEYRSCLELLQEELERLQRLASNLLLLAELDTPEDQASAVRLESVFEDLSAIYEPVAGDADVTLRFECAGETEVAAEERDVRRLFVNLLDNALKHTPTGGRIDVVAAADASRVTATVSDTGAGFPPEDAERVFERFYQCDPARTRREGSAGLGLSICKAIVERCGGTIAAASPPDGCTITVVLPVADNGDGHSAGKPAG